MKRRLRYSWRWLWAETWSRDLEQGLGAGRSWSKKSSRNACDVRDGVKARMIKSDGVVALFDHDQRTQDSSSVIHSSCRRRTAVTGDSPPRPNILPNRARAKTTPAQRDRPDRSPNPCKQQRRRRNWRWRRGRSERGRAHAAHGLAASRDRTTDCIRRRSRAASD